jgi:hypothetical protein
LGPCLLLLHSERTAVGALERRAAAVEVLGRLAAAVEEI